MISNPHVEVGSLLNGRYLVQQNLVGGMSQIAVCKDMLADEKDLVVLKSLTAECSDHDAIVAEADAWLRLGSAAQTFYLGLSTVATIRGRLTLVMPYCSRGNLRARMTRGPLRAEQAFSYATQILLGLWQLEQSGIVHCDLKPENVLFDSRDQVKLSDLGIARVRDQGTLMGTLDHGEPDDRTRAAGTLPYIAPEQLEGRRDLDSRVDMWAFGVLVIELLTGTRPFQGRTAEEAIQRIRTAAPEGLDRIDATLPKRFRSLVPQLLEKKRSKRFRSIRELLGIWDEVVRVGTPSNRRIWWGQDCRVPVHDPLVSSYWCTTLFPDRLGKQNGLISYSVAKAQALKRAETNYQLDRFEAAIDEADKVLGKFGDIHAPIMRLIAGSLPLTSSMQRRKGGALDLEIVLGAEGVCAALRVKLEAMVGLIDAKMSGSLHLQGALEICRAVVASPNCGSDVTALAAQVFALSGQSMEAKHAVSLVLEAEPTNVSAWLTLFFIASKSEDFTRAEAVANDATAHLNSGDFLAQRILAQMWGDLGAWERVVRFAGAAVNKRNDDIESLFMLTAALWNAGRRDEARKFYKRMAKLAPSHPRTSRLLPLFSGSSAK